MPNDPSDEERKPTLRDAITPLVVGIAAAATIFVVEYFAGPNIWIIAGTGGLGAWLAAFAMTGRWK